MNQNKNCAELKLEAKESLLGKYGTVIGAIILIELITLGISMIVSYLVPTTTFPGIIIYYIITLIIELLSAVLTVGLIYLNLNIICNRPYKVSNIFFGFQSHPDKAIIIQFLLLLFSMLCMVPAIILLFVYYFNQNSVLIMFITLLAVAGLVAAIIIGMMFSQSFYLLLDFPDYGAKDLMKLSKTIMKGNYGRLFYLYISFIPFFLLGLLSLGIGFLFIIPYMNMTMAHFYLDLIQCRKSADAAQTIVNY